MKILTFSLLLMMVLLGCAHFQRSLYGKASLSREETRILYKPFDPDLRNSRHNNPKAWSVAIICMKHRLTCNEIMDLIASPPDSDGLVETERVVVYKFAIQGALQFYFDLNGILKDVRGFEELPHMEAVTPDTPIEPHR